MSSEGPPLVPDGPLHLKPVHVLCPRPSPVPLPPRPRRSGSVYEGRPAVQETLVPDPGGRWRSLLHPRGGRGRGGRVLRMLDHRVGDPHTKVYWTTCKTSLLQGKDRSKSFLRHRTVSRRDVRVTRKRFTSSTTVTPLVLEKVLDETDLPCLDRTHVGGGSRSDLRRWRDVRTPGPRLL